MFGFTQSPREFDEKRHNYTSKEHGFRQVSVFHNGHEGLDEEEQREQDKREEEVNRIGREKEKKRKEQWRLQQIVNN